MTRYLLIVILIFSAIVVVNSQIPEPPTTLPLTQPINYGLYHWNTQKRDLLAATRAKELKARSVRVYLGYHAEFSYGIEPPWVDGQTDYLLSIAQTAEFRALFSDPDFDTFMLTLMTHEQFVKSREGDWGSLDLGTIFWEYYNLANFLTINFPNKLFILSNWEGDWLLAFNESQAVEFEAMFAAVLSGINAVISSNVVACIEFVHIEGRVIEMAERLGYSLISYSAWATTIPIESDPVMLESGLNAAIDRIHVRTHNKYLGAGLIIGEIGKFKTNVLDEYRFMQPVDRVLRKWRVVRVYYWQLFEDGSHSQSAIGLDGYLSPIGAMLRFFNSPKKPIVFPTPKRY